ncbi:MAG: HAD family phosphatase [Trueperaceae bacterium]
MRGTPEVGAVLFDMDGVLLDSERPSLALLQARLRAHGVEVDDHVLRSVCGRPRAYLRGLLSPRLQGVGVETDDFVADYDARKEIALQAGEIRPFPAAVPLLRGLRARGWRLALATSTERPRMAARLANTGILELFDAAVTGEEVVNGKPAPDIFLLAAERLGVRPDRCWVVEDSLAGVEAGRAGGMRVAAVAGTFDAEALMAADRVFGDLAELAAAVDVWGEPAVP